MITLKTPKQLKVLSEGGVHLARILGELKNASKVGISGLEIEQLAKKLIKRIGGEPSFKGFKDYPACICISFNDEVVHGIPSKKAFKKGDLISLDLGLRYRGLYSDAAISFVVGSTPTPIQKKLLDTTKTALREGIKQIKPGKRLGFVSAKIEETAKKAGFSVIYNLVGHGVGFAVHEEPPVPNFGEKESGPELKPGMVLAIEPMLSLGSSEVKIAENRWTAKTRDGSLSCHFEHTVAVTESSYKILTLDKKLGFC